MNCYPKILGDSCYFSWTLAFFGGLMRDWPIGNSVFAKSKVEEVKNCLSPDEERIGQVFFAPDSLF